MARRRYHLEITRIDSEHPHRSTRLASGEVILPDDIPSGDCAAALERAVNRLEQGVLDRALARRQGEPDA